MGVEAQQLPVQGPVVAPLRPRPELVPHEQQLLPRVGEHEGVERPQVGELPPLVPGHLGHHGCLPVHDLVVGEGKHEALGERVQETEGELLLVVYAEQGILAEVGEHVVHEPHVPHGVEAEPSRLHGVGHASGPGGGLLGHHERPRAATMHHLVELAEEGDGIEVLPSAMAVGHPLAGLAAVVEVEHGGHRVHPQTVHVVDVEPEHGIGHEEVPHLVAPVVEDVGAPVGMLPLARVGVLVERGAVEAGERELVAGEVGGHPVEEHPDPRPVEPVHEGHELGGFPVAPGGGEVSRDLVAPGAVEGMLHHRHQFHVGEAELLHVGDETIGELPVGEPGAVLPAHPGPEVDLVDGEGALEGLPRPALLHPRLVVPRVGVEIHDPRRHPGAELEPEPHRVGAQVHRPGGAAELVPVVVAGAEAGDEELPDPGRAEAAHHVDAPVPPVPVAHHAHPRRVGGPHREPGAGHAAHRLHVGAELAVELLVPPLAREQLVDLAQGGKERVGIGEGDALPVGGLHAEPVGEHLRAVGEVELEEAVGVAPLHRRDRVVRRVHQGHCGGVGAEGAHHDPLAGDGVHSEPGVGLAHPRLHQGSDLLRAEIGTGLVVHGFTIRNGTAPGNPEPRRMSSPRAGASPCRPPARCGRIPRPSPPPGGGGGLGM